MMSLVAPAVAPDLSGWRTTTIALGCALLIGGVGGLIGLGGGEFRLPILVGLIGFTARAAVPINQILSLVTLATALVMRWHTGSLVGAGPLRRPLSPSVSAGSRLPGFRPACCQRSPITDSSAQSPSC